MDDGRTVAAGFVAVALGAVLFYKGFRWNAEYNCIRDTPTSTCRSVAMGPVEVIGKAKKATRELTSPLGGEKCYYYAYKVQEYRSSGKNSRWVTIDSGKDCVPFYLDDGTGQVLVDAEGAEIDLPKTFAYETGVRRPVPTNVQKFMAAKGHSLTTLFGFNKTLRFTEIVIKAGTPLYILGYAGDNPDVAAGEAQKNEENILIHKGEDLPFLISDKSEKELLGSLAWKRFGGQFGGIALIVTGLAIIFAFFGVL